MGQNTKAAVSVVIMGILLFIFPCITTDTAYAAYKKETKTTSDNTVQSKNIQNKTDSKEPIISQMRSLMLSSGYSLKTSLNDGFTMRASKKTFDVWARRNGTKIDADAAIYRTDSSGERKHIGNLSVAWDDGNKVSYIIDMGKQASGDFIIEVSVGTGNNRIAKEYNFTYDKTPKGGYIGDITIDIEAFTLSLGYIAEPMKFPVYEGENGAQVLDRYLNSLGYTYECTGSLTGGFYLGRICGLSTDLSIASLEKTVAAKLDEDSWTGDIQQEHALGEFDFTDQSGWMYSVNNVFPNVGFSDYYLDDGDVMRVQFTVASGKEIGGSGSIGGWNPDWYAVADKDEATDLLADINSALNAQVIKDDQRASRLIEQLTQMNATIAVSQGDVDESTDQLRSYLYGHDGDTSIELSESELTVQKNRTKQIGITIGNITSLKPLQLNWITDDPMIATVDNGGNVTGQGAGTTTIKAVIGNAEAECAVTVEEKPLTGIKIVPADFSRQYYEEHETELGEYTVPTPNGGYFEVEPVPADTTDDYTPVWNVDTRKYISYTTYDSLFHGNGIREGTTVITAKVGEFTDSVTVNTYENKVKSFSLNDSEYARDGEIIFNINDGNNVNEAVFAFTPDPTNAQDYSSYTFTSSDPIVFTTDTNVASYPNSVKVRLHPHKDGVAELYVTIGNVTKTYPVTVNDMDGPNNIVISDYSALSQIYSMNMQGSLAKELGGERYLSGEPYYGIKDKNQFTMSLSDPGLILAEGGYPDENGKYHYGQSYSSRNWVATNWYPYITGATGTATVINKMFGADRVVSKVVVADEVVSVDTVTLRNGDEDASESAEYGKGDEFTLTASIAPENATGELVWYSSDADVATVDQNGHVEIKGYGDADIVACIAGKYDVHKVHVDQPMTDMVISNETLNMTTGITRTLKAWCVPNDTSDDHTITWTSSDPTIVSVTNKGRIKTLSEGHAVITASAGSFSVTCDVTVDDSVLRRLYFPKSPLYAEVGETIHISEPATVPENAVTSDTDYTWSSSNEEKAIVDQDGNVTILSASYEDRNGLNEVIDQGERGVRIYAEKDGIRGTCMIEIGCPTTGIGLSQEEVTLVKGQEVELETIFYPEFATDQRNAVTWVSSNPLVVSQREEATNAAWKRTITGLKLGESVVTAKFGEFSASCRVKVVLPEDQQAAYDLQKKIEGWTELDPVSDRADYVSVGLEIQETWETFTDAQKKLVGGYNEYFAEHLEEIREMAASDERVASVVSLIDSIGEVTLSDESQAKITSAREAYNALTDDEKARFDAEVLKTLTDAETRLAELRDEADRKAREANALQLKIEGWAQLDPVLNRAEYVSTGLEIQDTWESFADDQKEMVPGYNTLFAPHLDEIREMAASNQRVADVVSLIGSIGEVNLDDTSQAKINAAREGFDALTGEEKARVGADTLKVLTDAEEKISQLQEEENRKTQAALDLQNKIEQWTALDPVTDRDEYVKTGLEIQVAWESFTDAQKALVPGYEASFAPHLEEIKKMAESDKKVADVISLIDSIGDVTLDDACRAKIDAARKAFDALTDEQKDKVGLRKLQVLIDAELRIKELQKEADKQETIRKKKAAAKKLKIKGLKVKAKSRKFTLTWKKTKGASGYQIQYRKKGAKKFSSLKTTKLKVRTKKLKKNKKYQFRVRTYIKIEGKPVYGKWTKIKTVKCK